MMRGASAVRPEVRQGRLSHQKNAGEVYRHDPVPHLQRGLFERSARTLTGIVDEDIDQAERVARSLHAGFDRGTIGDVKAVGDADLVFAELFSQRFQGFRPPSG